MEALTTTISATTIPHNMMGRNIYIYSALSSLYPSRLTGMRQRYSSFIFHLLCANFLFLLSLLTKPTQAHNIYHILIFNTLPWVLLIIIIIISFIHSSSCCGIFIYSYLFAISQHSSPCHESSSIVAIYYYFIYSSAFARTSPWRGTFINFIIYPYLSSQALSNTALTLCHEWIRGSAACVCVCACPSDLLFIFILFSMSYQTHPAMKTFIILLSSLAKLTLPWSISLFILFILGGVKTQLALLWKRYSII